MENRPKKENGFAPFCDFPATPPDKLLSAEMHPARSSFYLLHSSIKNPWLVSSTSSHPALSKKSKETKGLGRSSYFAFRGESNAERRMQSAEWQNAKGRKPVRASGKQLCSSHAAADSPSDTSRRWGSVEQSHRCPTQPLSRRCGCHHSATEGQIQWRYG